MNISKKMYMKIGLISVGIAILVFAIKVVDKVDLKSNKVSSDKIVNEAKDHVSRISNTKDSLVENDSLTKKSSKVNPIFSSEAESGPAASSSVKRKADFSNKKLSTKQQALSINVKEAGALGDGTTNDRVVIQRAIDKLANSGGGTLYFPNGTYAIYNQSLIIWGSNINVVGESRDNVVIVKKGAAGQYGDCIDIMGKVGGSAYFGDFGKGDYSRRSIYKGKTVPANNISIKNITVDTKLTNLNPLANNLGIVNCNSANIENCTFKNAPQTNVAMVNRLNENKNGKINFVNCSFENSGRHNVRVISYNQGAIIGNDVSFNNCRFLQIENPDVSVPDLKALGNQKVHLWYRGASKSGFTQLKVNNCYFDQSGIVYANVNANNLFIQNSKLLGGLVIRNQGKFERNPKIVIEENTISIKNSSKVGVASLTSDNLIKARIFGTVSPSASSSVTMQNNNIQ